VAKTVALFVDVESLHGRLRSLHHRTLDPKLVVDAAREHGELACAVALGDWGSLPEGLKGAFEAAEVELAQVDRSSRGRESGGGRRREVLRDLVDLEILARMIELLFADGGPEIDGFVVATSEDVAARGVALVRERFSKAVHVVGVEGAVGEPLTSAAESCSCLPMPRLEPQDEQGLEELVPLLEKLEQRKRYLNFKYIRESAARKLKRLDRSFEAAERLLSDAIACGLLQKVKVEDKYTPGQRFTAYQLDRDCDLFARFGSGEPAPTHDEEPPADEGPAVPTLGRSRSEPSAASDAQETAAEEEGERKKRRRRRRRAEEEAEQPTPAVSAGATPAARGKKKKKGRRGGNHQQDRVGRTYEAPSRFLPDPSEEVLPLINDEDLDEDQILAARGDFR
jgi:hypothetical protein